jgi:hypothetical protein
MIYSEASQHEVRSGAVMTLQAWLPNIENTGIPTPITASEWQVRNQLP